MEKSEVEKIISLARDKYTVHECSECTYRKCCDLNSNGYGSAECLSRRVSISLMLGIEDSYFTKLLDDIEAAWKREKAKAEADALAVGGIVEAERHSPGNAAAMCEALVALRDAARNFCHQILNSKYNDIMDKYKCRERGFPALLDLRYYAIPKANAALSAPPRQCDVGTAAEQGERCMAQFDQWRRKGDGMKLITAIMAWAQKPYEAEEGAGK